MCIAHNCMILVLLREKAIELFAFDVNGKSQLNMKARFK